MIAARIRPAAFALAALTPLAADLPAAAEPWQLDRERAAVSFSLAHAGFAMVEGRFNAFDAAIDFDPSSGAAASVSFSIEAASIDTGWETRDDFIRGGALLDVDDYPSITFVSHTIETLSDQRALVTGLVTIKGVSREETFDVTLNSLAPSAEAGGALVADVTVQGQIDRTDYGVSAFAPAVASTMALRVDLAASPRP